MELGVYRPPEYEAKGWGYIMLRITIGGLPGNTKFCCGF